MVSRPCRRSSCDIFHHSGRKSDRRIFAVVCDPGLSLRRAQISQLCFLSSFGQRCLYRPRWPGSYRWGWMPPTGRQCSRDRSRRRSAIRWRRPAGRCCRYRRGPCGGWRRGAGNSGPGSARPAAEPDALSRVMVSSEPTAAMDAAMLAWLSGIPTGPARAPRPRGRVRSGTPSRRERDAAGRCPSFNPVSYVG
jgi:hypothetical protein